MTPGMRDNEPHHVYRYYAADDSVLYVGVTSNLAKRDMQHREKFWYAEVDHMEYETFPTKWGGMEAERIAIQRYAPRYNKTHRHATASSPLGMAVGYTMARHPELADQIVDEFDWMLRERAARKEIQQWGASIRRVERQGAMVDSAWMRDYLKRLTAELDREQRRRAS